ncbi:MAG: hypothetical protein ACF8GE_09645 [Phycisphaerales bacterium JB043]
MNTRSALTLLACAGMSTSALAQDSVAISPGLPGDATSPWDATEQINDFIVQLTSFTSSKGHLFGIAPVLKASKTDPAQFSSLMSAQAASADQINPANFLAPSYMRWNAPGFGVNGNAALNSPGTPTAPPAGVAPIRVGVGFSEFATSAAAQSVESIIGGIIEYDPANPSTLYVRKVVAATNDEDGTGPESSLGFGTVDASGFIQLRADEGFPAVTGLGTHPIPAGVNINGRVDMIARVPGIINVIGDFAGLPGGTDAGATVVPTGYDATTHNTPGLLPQSERVAAGGSARPVMLTTNFAGNFRNEAVAGTLTAGSGAHRNDGVDTNDQRGSVAYSTTRVFTAGPGGTAGMLTKPGPAGPDTTSISIWGLDAGGNPTATFTAPIVDPLTDTSALDGPYQFADFGVTGLTAEFTNYQSQAAFRGGNSQVAIGEDKLGNILIAGPVTVTGAGAADSEGAIAVARFDPTNPAGTIQWTMAGWNNAFPAFPQVSAGKGIYDAGGVRIGEFCTLTEVTGGAPQGPSFANPMFDAAGNCWFLAAVQLFNGTGDDDFTGETDDEFNTALVRAIYDPVAFSFEVEKIFDVGNVFTSQNTGLDYQLRFIGIADNNSISSGTQFSHNMVQGALADGPAGLANGLAQDDPTNLGGLVISAGIIYDANSDGSFDDPTTVPGSQDQEYNVLLYIGSGVNPPCPADFDNDGDVDGADLGLFLGLWGPCPAPCAADFDNDGDVDGADLGLFLGQWGPC